MTLGVRANKLALPLNANKKLLHWTQLEYSTESTQKGCMPFEGQRRLFFAA